MDEQQKTIKIKTNHGGRRPGAGRKPASGQDHLHARSVYMTEAEWDHCNWKWSLGVTASEYVRRLIQKDIRERRLREQKPEQKESDAADS